MPKPSDLPPLTDSFPFRVLSNPRLVESSHTPGNKVYEVKGVFQNYLLKNENGRVYPKRIWERLLKPDSDFMNRVARRNVVGHIEHPADGITKMEEASHVITDVHIATPAEISESRGKIEEGDIVGTYEVLPSENFPKAKILEGCIKAKLDFGGVSSRGNGTVTETGDRYEVNDDYMLETWDVVFTPSVKRAKPTVMNAFESSKPKAASTPVLKEDDDDKSPVTTDDDSDMNESSFCLITGLYGPGKPTEDKKFIPIQLIAESKGAAQSFFWKAVNETDKAPQLGTFKTFTEAMGAMTTLCESTGFVFETSSTPTPTTPTPPQNNMNAKDRIREIQAEAVMLASSKRKGLKLSEAASLLEKASSLRIELASIQEQNASFAPIIQPIAKKLVEFEEEMDAPPADDAPPPPPPAGDEGGGDDIPAIGDEGGGEGEMTADEASSILDKAIDALQSAGQEDVAQELQTVQDQIGDAAGDHAEPDLDDAGGGGNNVDLDDVPPMGDEDIPKLESIKNRKRFIENYRKLRSRYRRLSESSTRLLKAYKNLNESSPRGEGSATLKEAVDRANKSEAAAREIAARYNTEMIEFGQYVWQLKKPQLFEAHKAELAKCRTWKAYDELSRKIVTEAEQSAPAPAPAAPAAGAPGAEQKGAVTESAPKGGTPPVTESQEQKPAPVEESVHPMVASISRARQQAPLWS